MDDRLRSLVRAAETGDVAARGALLAERLRLRLVSVERLRLAAYLGDAGAQLCLNVPAPAKDVDLVARLRGLSPWGAEAFTRAIQSLMRAARVSGFRGPTPSPIHREGALTDLVVQLRQSARRAGQTDADLWATAAAALVPWALSTAEPLADTPSDLARDADPWTPGP